MKKLFSLFMICFLSSGGFLQGNEDRGQGNPNEIFCSCKKSFQKDQDGKTCFNPDRLWVFNGQAYLLNDSEQWEPSGLKVSQDIHEFLIDLYRRGICPKGHQGIHLDQRMYTERVSKFGIRLL